MNHNPNITIHNRDCQEVMQEMPDNHLDLTVTSPPYYNIKDYKDGFTKWKTYNDYLDDNVKWFTELFRVTKPGCYVCWNIQENLHFNDKKAKIRKAYPLLANIILIGDTAGFQWERQIIWNKNNSTQLMFGSYPYPTTPIFMHDKESILVFRKPGQRQPIPKEKKPQFKIDKETWFKYMKDVWIIGTASAKERDHDAPFPRELPKRFIKVMTWDDSLVFDPFTGSGTTAEVCLEMERNFVGCEISKVYYDKIISRTKKFNTTNFFTWKD